MNKGQIYQRRKEYIELILGAMLKPKTGFDSIKYGRYNKTDKEYVRLTDLRGNAVTLNITGEKLETTSESGATWRWDAPFESVHVVCMEQESLPTGTEMPSAGQKLRPTSSTVS